MRIQWPRTPTPWQAVFDHLSDELRALPTDRRALRKFGFVVGGVFLAIGVIWAYRRGWSLSIGPWLLLAASAPLLVFGFLVPMALRPAYLVWMGGALVLGTIMTRVLLTVVFFGIVTPTALLMRLFGKDPMHRRPDPRASSYWIRIAENPGTPERMDRYF